MCICMYLCVSMYVCVTRSEKAVEYVVEENGGDESHSHKELAIHTACFADTTRCRAPGNVPCEFENVSISIYL